MIRNEFLFLSDEWLHMVKDHWPDANFGISVGSVAPDISGKDIEDQKFKLKNVLKEYNGVLVFLFRGTW